LEKQQQQHVAVGPGNAQFMSHSSSVAATRHLWSASAASAGYNALN